MSAGVAEFFVGVHGSQRGVFACRRHFVAEFQPFEHAVGKRYGGYVVGRDVQHVEVAHREAVAVF